MNIQKKQNTVNKKTTKSLKKAYFSSDSTTIKRKKIRSKNFELISIDKKYGMTRSFQAIGLSLLSLYHSRPDDKKSIYMKGISRRKLAAFSGCSLRTVDAFFKTDLVYVKSGQKDRETNLIKLNKKLFEYFEELSTFLGDNFVEYIEVRHPNLRTNFTEVKYYVNYDNSHCKNIENEVKEAVCEELNISKKTFDFYFARFDIKKMGRRVFKTYLECFILYLKEGIRKGYIKTIAWFKKVTFRKEGIRDKYIQANKWFKEKKAEAVNSVEEYKPEKQTKRRGTSSFCNLFGKGKTEKQEVKTPEQLIEENRIDEQNKEIEKTLGMPIEEHKRLYPEFWKT